MEEELQFHQSNLYKLCRLCGNKLSKKKKGRNREPKDAVSFKDALLSFGVDISNDSQEIHPSRICEKCRVVCQKVEATLKSDNARYRPQIHTYVFESHTVVCKICFPETSGSNELQKAGRKRKSYTNQHNLKSESVIVKSKKEKPETDHNDEQDDSGFDIDKISKYSRDRGFIFIESEDLISIMLYLKVQEPYGQLKTLVSINIYNDLTWKVSVADKNISDDPSFEMIGSHFSTSSCLSLIEICSNLSFCVGNDDFSELCKSRRDENSNLATFYNKKNNLIASEVKDLICVSFGKESTIRHVNCKMIKNSENSRCEACLKYRSTLISLKHKQKKRIPLSNRTITHSSNIPNKHLPTAQLRQKLNSCQAEKKNLVTKNHKLRKKIKELLGKDGVGTDNDLHDTLKSSMGDNVFPEGSAIHFLFEEQKKQSQCKTAKQMRWHPIMIRWSLGLYHTSPAAYDFLKRSGFLKLPHRTTLLDYTLYTKPQSGFNPDVIERLYKEINIEKLFPHEKNVSVLFDEMKIKSNLIYAKASGQIIGFVELGEINEEINKLERQFAEEGKKTRQTASHVLAFMVRGIYTGFTFVFGFFPTTSASCDELFPVVWEAIEVLECLSLKVRCLVSDGASTNRSFYKLHKNKDDKVPFFSINLCALNRKVYFFCDPPHLIKTVRNNLENSHGNRNTKNLFLDKETISWNHIVQLWEFENNHQVPGLYMTKLRREHLDLTPSNRMNVKLAAQVLSTRVANALQYQGKPETKGTENFVRKFDEFFDCLNGQYPNQDMATKKPALRQYTDPTDKRFEWLKNTFLEGYVKRWETEALSTPGLKQRKAKRRLCLSIQTIEGLQTTVNAFTSMVQDLLCEYPGFYILGGRLNQDPLEQHFSAQRRRGGNSTNPTAHQFGYNELALHTIKSRNVKSLRGNSIMFDDSQIDFLTDNGLIPMVRRKRNKRAVETYL